MLCVAFAPDPERINGKFGTERKAFFVIYLKSNELIKIGCKETHIQRINHGVECDRLSVVVERARLQHGSQLFIYFKLE